VKRITLILVVIALLAATSAALTQSSASYTLPWRVVAGGGAHSFSSSYRVGGTVGQAAASLPFSTSASFRVGSGYWPGTHATLPRPAYPVYLPLVLREAD
jgi:hypothetical protein